MSFSDGFKKQAFVGQAVRWGIKKGIKAQGGMFNAGMNAIQGVADTRSNLQKFRAAERGIGGIR